MNKFKSFICIFLIVILILSGCKTNEEMVSKAEYIKIIDANSELKAQIELLSKELEGTRENHFSKYTVSPYRKFFGHYLKGAQQIFVQPSVDSIAVESSGSSEQVFVLSEIIDENNEEWALVKIDQQSNCFGYIQTSMLTNIKPKESILDQNYHDITLNGFKIGSDLEEVKCRFGTEYYEEQTEYGYMLLFGNYNGTGENETVITYNADDDKVVRIITTSKDYCLNSGFKVGDRAIDVITYYSILYPLDARENVYEFLLDSNFSLKFVVDTIDGISNESTIIKISLGEPLI